MLPKIALRAILGSGTFFERVPVAVFGNPALFFQAVMQGQCDGEVWLLVQRFTDGPIGGPPHTTSFPCVMRMWSICNW